MDKGKLFLWIAIGLLLSGVIATAVYKAWPLLYPEIMLTATVDSTCDLQRNACVARLPAGGTIRFSIEPRPIAVVKALILSVYTEGLEAQGVEVDFAGVDMNMGFNRPKLHAAAPGQFQGRGTLPVCVRSRMAWEAKVLVTTDQGLVSAPFRFTTFAEGASRP